MPPLPEIASASDFPYLTPEIVEQHGVQLLNWLRQFAPENPMAVAIFGALITLIPLMDAIPAIRAAIQTGCDEWNKYFNTTPGTP